MKKTDTNYLCSNYKETKMLEKVTVGYRQQSRITRLFYNRRYPKDHPRSFPDMGGLWQRLSMLNFVPGPQEMPQV